MRSPRALILLLAGVVMAGCSASSSLESALPPSPEITNAIRPSKPVPTAEVASRDVGFAAEPAEEVVAGVEPPASVPDLQANALVPAARPTTLAMMVPDKPVTREAAPRAGTIYRKRFRDAKPINFGSSSPHKLAVHGVDVSRWQGDLDWVKLRSQGANFAYIKATDGGDHLDPMFRKNWREAKAAGLKRGAYHFFYWCRTAGEQADWFIRNVPKEAGALPPVIDVEWNGESRCKRVPSPAKVREKMQVFMDKLEAHYGQRPIIYTAPDFYADNLKGAFPNHPFWLRAVAQHPSKVYPGRKWVFWQYSGSGLSHGVSGKIDLNVFHGTEREWHRWVADSTGVPAG